MFKLFKQFKKKLTSTQQQHQYRQYTHPELKIIAMRTRMIFEQIYRKESAKISQDDTRFKKVQSSQGTLKSQYEILQQIGMKVIEVETIKLYIEILKKIEAYAPQIINTNGDISLLKEQLKWFQSILWYRKCKKLHNIEEFNTFCWNFFKGLDVTTELKINCELFRLYPVLQYLEEDKIIPLDLCVEKATPYVSFMIKEEDLNQMKKINAEQIRVKRQEEIIKNSRETFTNPTHIVNPNNNVPQNQFQIFNNRLTPPYQNLPYKNPNSYSANEQNFLPPPYPHPYANPSQFFNPPFENDEFAVDRFSKKYSASKATDESKKKSLQKEPKHEKTFKSPNLKLIDWQSMYEQSNQQPNPYVNSSKVRLISPQQNYCSQNFYDRNTLPYPPSGVLPGQQIKYDNDHKFYVDMMEKHLPQPIGENSFLKNIQNQFFSQETNKRNHNYIQKQYDKQIDGPYHRLIDFNEDDLLKQLQSQNQKQKPKELQGSCESQKKGFNRLFGMKVKSDQIQKAQQTASQSIINRSKSPQNKQTQIQIDSILDSYSQTNMQQSEAKHLNSDDLESFMNSFGNKQGEGNEKRQNNKEESQKDFQDIEKQLNDMQVHDEYRKSLENIQNQSEEKINQDILSLIQSKRRTVCGENNDKRFEENHQNLQIDDNHQQFNPSSEGQLSYFANKTLHSDLIDSLRLIKRHLGEEDDVDSTYSEQNKLLSPSSRQNISNASIKKPYMISIYARDQYLKESKQKQKSFKE